MLSILTGKRPELDDRRRRDPVWRHRRPAGGRGDRSLGEPDDRNRNHTDRL